MAVLGYEVCSIGLNVHIASAAVFVLDLGGFPAGLDVTFGAPVDAERQWPRTALDETPDCSAERECGALLR